jgi:hypothetical protein
MQYHNTNIDTALAEEGCLEELMKTLSGVSQVPGTATL